MAKKAIIRGPDLDSAKREFMTGQHLDKVPRDLGAKPRSPMSRRNNILRSAVGSRRSL